MIVVKSIVASVAFNSTGAPVVKFVSFVVNVILEIVVVVAAVVVDDDVVGCVVVVSFVLFSRECPCIRRETNNMENVALESPILKVCCKDWNWAM